VTGDAIEGTRNRSGAERMRSLQAPFATALAIAWVAVVVFLLSIWLRPWPDSIFLTDFAAFWTGASMVERGEGGRLYDMEAQRLTQQSLREAGASTDQVRGAKGYIPFHNPPMFALLLAPLTALPLMWGYGIWLLTSVWAFLFSLILLLGRDRRGLLIVVTLVAFPAVADTLLWGQMVGFLALFLALGLVALRANRPFLGGLLLGLLLLKPQYAVAFPVLFLLKGRWRELAGMGVSAVVMAVASLIVVSPAGALSYVELMRSIGAFSPPPGSCVSPEMMVNWRALLLAAWPSVSDSTGSLLLFGLGLLTVMASLWAWRGPWVPQSPRFSFQMIALMIATLLASPHSHFHGLALLLPPAAMMMRDLPGRPSLKGLETCGLAGIYLLATALWWLSLLTPAGRTLFWILVPLLALVLSLLVIVSSRGTSAWVLNDREEGRFALNLGMGRQA
jgi:hypothetical protein